MPTDTSRIETLRAALQIAEQIQSLEAELKLLLAGKPSGTVEDASPSAGVDGRRSTSRKRASSPKKPKRAMSPESRARIVAAQKARWAKWRKNK